MKIFRLITGPLRRANGHEFHHLRLEANRSGQWVPCGVFQLRPVEWAALQAICELYDIEVRPDEQSVSAHSA